MTTPSLNRRTLPSAWTRDDVALATDAVASHSHLHAYALWKRFSDAFTSDGTRLLLTRRECTQLRDALMQAAATYVGRDGHRAYEMVGNLL